ncbi:MAG: hypothetical protein L0332_21900 [Chloroflexi bacterium]|nr:hypothetical protein [Chloroflexota bacterium]MCI0649573.1 hypothetical protein [Chloroflexota bacterium]MCI0729351.1 hypothetical protein [Chloroflexota bacterium]
MSQFVNNVEETLFRFLIGEIPLEEFETWVYSSKELESYLNSDAYLELISFNFQKKGAGYEVKSLLYKHIDVGKYETWRIKKLLGQLLNEERDLVELLEIFYVLYCGGYRFLERIGYQHVMVDNIPRLTERSLWNTLAFEKAREALGRYITCLKPEALKVLEAIDKGQIKITGEFEYQIDPEIAVELEKRM